MPYPNEHSCRLKNPDDFVRFTRVNCQQKHNGKCIDVIFGWTSENAWQRFVNRWREFCRRFINAEDAGGEIQALRYDKKIWDADDARAHCKSRDGTFEAATEDNWRR